MRALKNAGRIAAVVACATLTSCSSVDLSDVSGGGNDPSNETAGLLMTTFGGLGLGIGTTALFTVDDATGRPLEDRREISLAIARGAGPFVTDLAQWLELPPSLLPVLGLALREARPVLGPALEADISVASFQTLLGVALCRDPKLRFHAWRRFDCEALAPLHALPVPPESLLAPI